MSATTASPVDVGTPDSRKPSAVRDVLEITRRSLWNMRRTPAAFADATF